MKGADIATFLERLAKAHGVDMGTLAAEVHVLFFGHPPLGGPNPGQSPEEQFRQEWVEARTPGGGGRGVGKQRGRLSASEASGADSHRPPRDVGLSRRMTISWGTSCGPAPSFSSMAWLAARAPHPPSKEERAMGGVSRSRWFGAPGGRSRRGTAPRGGGPQKAEAARLAAEAQRKAATEARDRPVQARLDANSARRQKAAAEKGVADARTAAEKPGQTPEEARKSKDALAAAEKKLGGGRRGVQERGPEAQGCGGEGDQGPTAPRRPWRTRWPSMKARRRPTARGPRKAKPPRRTSSMGLRGHGSQGGPGEADGPDAPAAAGGHPVGRCGRAPGVPLTR